MNKRILSIVVAVLMCLSISAPAMAAGSDTVNATYSSGTVTVTGSGLSAGYSYSARVVNTDDTTLIAMQQVTADSSGVIAASILTGALASGDYAVYVNKADGTLAASDTFTISSGGGGGSTNTYYTISAIQSTGGTITLSSSSVIEGGSVTATITPNNGYIVSNVLVNDASVGAVRSYIITNISENTTVEAVFNKIGANPYSDVLSDAWYFDAVMYATTAGIMEGTSSTAFEPNIAMTRAMFVTVLYRLAGDPSVSGSSKYTDVISGSWYEDAVIWGTANGIVKGMGDNEFAPDLSVTREQMAAFMYRYASFSGVNVTISGSSISAYGDYDSVSGWAITAINWAVEKGLINGMSATTLEPQGTATRAQAATILMRFSEDML